MPPSGREVARRAVTEGAGVVWGYDFVKILFTRSPPAAPPRQPPLGGRQELFLYVGRGLAPAALLLKHNMTGFL